MDSGATYNYIKSNSNIGESVPLPRIYTPKTLHGYSRVRAKRTINLLDHDLTFFEIDELVDFDMILGEQGLRQIKATVNFFDYKINYQKPIPLHKINYTNDHLGYQKEISELMTTKILTQIQMPTRKSHINAYFKLKRHRKR